MIYSANDVPLDKPNKHLDINVGVYPGLGIWDVVVISNPVEVVLSDGVSIA